MWAIGENQEEQLIFEYNAADDVRLRMVGEGGKWRSLSRFYSTKETLFKECDILEKPCIICKRWIQAHFIEQVRKQMIEKNMCFGCNLWDQRLSVIKRDPDVMIVRAAMYTIEPDFEGHGFHGFGGAEFVFKRFDTGKTIVSHNVWFGGEIPWYFLPVVPDNAIMLHSYGINKTI